jgi:predicted tellurium resistance membrane protein TerC
VQGIVFVSGQGTSISAHHLAFIRTLVISVVSLCMALAGSRPSHAVMRYLAYGALAFLAAKLLFEDLRHGHMEFIAASIFVFAITLIAVPRLVRMGKGIHGPNLAK